MNINLIMAFDFGLLASLGFFRSFKGLFMGMMFKNQPFYTPGTDPHFLKLFYVLDTQPYGYNDFLRTS